MNPIKSCDKNAQGGQGAGSVVPPGNRSDSRPTNQEKTASLALQGGLAINEYCTGNLNTTIIEQNLLDGSSYDVGKAAITAALRVASNVFRNRHSILETVF